MALSVAPLYAALLGFLLVYLSIRVIRLRRRFKVAIGAGGEAAIERAARVQANFSEYVPMALILLLLAEIQGGLALGPARHRSRTRGRAGRPCLRGQPGRRGLSLAHTRHNADFLCHHCWRHRQPDWLGVVRTSFSYHCRTFVAGWRP